MKIYLQHNNVKFGGPSVVYQNLIKGLQDLNVSIASKPSESDYIGCLQHPGSLYGHLPDNTLMGPNIFVIPSDSKEICDKFSNFIVPSEWVRNLYSSFELMNNKNIQVWSSGIDTEYWKPKSSLIALEQEDKLDCFIYFKNRTQQDLAIAYKICNYFKLKFEIIEYGSYKEEQLKNLCSRSKFAVLLTGTESQGIAYMNILSMNIPCFVFNNPTWTHEKDKNIKCNASSVPYFDEKCGIISKDVDLKLFKFFLEKVYNNDFSPRNYILQNHTLKMSAQKYVDLLKSMKE